VRATDYPVGGATRAAVLAIGRQARTVYAFRTFPRVAAARPTIPRTPHYLPTSATDVVNDATTPTRTVPGATNTQGQPDADAAESLRTVRLERTGGASGGFLLLPLVRVCLLSLWLLRARITSPHSSTFLSFTLVSYSRAIPLSDALIVTPSLSTLVSLFSSILFAFPSPYFDRDFSTSLT